MRPRSHRLRRSALVLLPLGALSFPTSAARSEVEAAKSLLAAAMQLEEVARAMEAAGGDAPPEAWRAASAAFVRAAEQDPAGPGYWRAARALWLVGDQLPVEATEGRIELFSAARDLAAAGIAANEACAPCMLWKSISLALLSCIGATKDRPDRLEEERAVLTESLAMKAVALDNKREQEAARIMLEAPAKACGYAGDTWLELDEKDAASITGIGG